MQTARKKNKYYPILVQLSLYVVVLLILLLTSLNVEKITRKNKVLGIDTSSPEPQNTSTIFWEKFLKEHPDYIPGWIEIGRIDKVLEIDPNYFLHSAN